MHTENANNQNVYDLVKLHDFIANVAAPFKPAISEVINDAVKKAVRLSTAPTMSKQDFAAAKRLNI